MNNIANQMKAPYAVISVNASNYFDRVVHSISTMTCKYFGLPDSYIAAFFSTIEDIQMYRFTLFGLSEQSYMGSFIKPFQGLI